MALSHLFSVDYGHYQGYNTGLTTVLTVVHPGDLIAVNPMTLTPYDYYTTVLPYNVPPIVPLLCYHNDGPHEVKPVTS